MAILRRHPSPLLLITVVLIVAVDDVISQRTEASYMLCDPTTPDVLPVGPYDNPFIIDSPNFGTANYSDNTNCSFTLQSGSQPLVLTFYYRHFEVEVTPGCHFDSLCIHGIKFCGSWVTGHEFRYILPENCTSTVFFISDGSETMSGFEILVTPELAVTNQRVDQAIGDGSDINGITYETSIYYPGMPCKDRCSLPSATPSTTLPPTTTTTTTTSTVGAQTPTVDSSTENAGTPIDITEETSTPLNYVIQLLNSLSQIVNSLPYILNNQPQLPNNRLQQLTNMKILLRKRPLMNNLLQLLNNQPQQLNNRPPQLNNLPQLMNNLLQQMNNLQELLNNLSQILSNVPYS